MSNQVELAALSSLLSILGLIYIVFWRYRALCMDWFRQDVFDLRDELFDYAASGHIGFDNPAYGALRSTMNGYIRFAHQATAWHGIIFSLLLSKYDWENIKNRRSFEGTWRKSLDQTTPEVKASLECFRRRLDGVVLRYFLLSCPELILLASPLILVFGILYLVSKVGALRVVVRLQRRVSKSDDVAFLYGEAA